MRTMVECYVTSGGSARMDLTLPKGAVGRSVSADPSGLRLSMWLEVPDDRADGRIRGVAVVTFGDPIPEGTGWRFVGSAYLGGTVYHVFLHE